MSEQVPSRIEVYYDLNSFAYLREFNGHIPRCHPESMRSAGGAGTSPRSNRVVVAEEISGDDGRVIRGWYILLDSAQDGLGFVDDSLKGRIVCRDIQPGAKTADWNPYSPITLAPLNLGELRRIQQERDERLADRERHVMYSQTYLDALRNAEGWKSNVEHLNNVVAQKDAEIKKRDDELAAQLLSHTKEVWELKNENEANRQQIANLQASYAKLWNQKSLRGRIKAWFQSLRKCRLRRAA